MSELRIMPKMHLRVNCNPDTARLRSIQLVDFSTFQSRSHQSVLPYRRTNKPLARVLHAIKSLDCMRYRVPASQSQLIVRAKSSQQVKVN
jgi:hypothetical protein